MDVLRGYALLAITLNHFALVAMDLGVAGVIRPTLTPLGFSSAAELFVLCSGFAWARAAERSLRTAGFGALLRRALRRCALLLGALLLMTLACATVIRLLIPAAARMRDSFAMTPHVFGAPWSMLRQMATLQWTPAYLDVLGLYVLLLAAAPLLFRGLVAHSRATLAASAALYLLGATDLVPLPALQLPTWTFHPFAWQALFVLGMAAGRWDWLSRLPPDRRLLAGLLAALAACLAVKAVSLRGVGLDGWQIGPFFDSAVPLTDKTRLGPLRVAHALGLVAALSIAYRRARPWLRAALTRFPGGLGRLSLPVFVLSNPLIFLAGGVLALAPGRLAFALLCIGLMLALPLAARAWRRSPFTAEGRKARLAAPAFAQ